MYLIRKKYFYYYFFLIVLYSSPSNFQIVKLSYTNVYITPSYVSEKFFVPELQEYCSTALLESTQEIDRVWHSGLLYKLQLHLPTLFSILLRSYLTDKIFTVRYHTAITNWYPILAGVSQSSNIIN